MQCGLKDLEEEQRYRKGAHARVSVITLSLCMLPSPLLYFPCRPSLWQKYKGVKSKPAEAHCLRELWWKIQIKWYQFWNMFKDAAGCWMESAKSSKDSTYITRVLSHILWLYNLENPVDTYNFHTHTCTQTYSRTETISLSSQRCSTMA